MQHPLKQDGDTRFIYFRKWNTFGTYPYPKTTEYATFIISEPCLELSPVLTGDSLCICVLIIQNQVCGINCNFQVKLLLFVLCSTGNFGPCSEPWSLSAEPPVYTTASIWTMVNSSLVLAPTHGPMACTRLEKKESWLHGRNRPSHEILGEFCVVTLLDTQLPLS